MACQSSRISRLIRWRYLRWALALPALPLALWACNSHPLVQPEPRAQQETDFAIAVNPERMIDIVFLVDDSPSMEEEQASLAKNFPKMIDELKKLPGGLPDVHIGVVSSDMGAGPVSLGGNCSTVLGKRGVFQTSGNGSRNCGLKPDALWIEQIQGKAPNFTGDISDVFSCMAQLGVKGCGYEHQLQALRVALSTETTPKHRGFLRDNAYLAIVIISDEDDCSAEPGSDMFDQPLENEMASLRCATRGHTCGGQALPFPTTGEFSANLADCKAKDSANKNELPLIRVQEFVDYVRNVKPRPDEQIVVAGIFGWPLDRENLLDPKGQPTRYRIGKDATAAAELRGLWDYLPVCEVPGLGKSYAGLRLKAFVDAFGDNGQSFSLCSGDFTESMQKIGEKLRLKLENSCVAYKLIDKDADRAGLQPECQVFDSIPDGRKYRDVQIPACANNPNARPCWQLAEDFKTCPNLGQKIDVLRTEKPPSGTKLVMKCLTCALPDGNCPAE